MKTLGAIAIFAGLYGVLALVDLVGNWLATIPAAGPILLLGLLPALYFTLRAIVRAARNN